MYDDVQAAASYLLAALAQHDTDLADETYEALRRLFPNELQAALSDALESV